MPQITQLDNDPTPNNNDLLVTVDMAAGTTKNISREQFFTGAPLPANTLNGQAIADGSVTPEKRSGGFKVGNIPSSTFSSTGTKSITGVGFNPKLIRLTLLPTANSAIATFGLGAFDGTSQYYAATTGSRRSGTDACIVMLDDSGNIIMRAVGVSLNADGFTLNVTTSQGINVAYEAYA